MPGFMRPDFPEVPDSKVTIGEHRDGAPMRVTGVYEVGSLSDEPVLHEKMMETTPSVDPDAQKLIDAISNFVKKSVPSHRRQRSDEKRTG
jgi:hypothetical protein